MLRPLLMLSLALVLVACGDDTKSTWEETVSGAPPTAQPLRAPRIQTLDNPGTLSEFELAAQPPDLFDANDALLSEPPPKLEPIAIDKAGTVQLEILSEIGYLDAQKRYVIDLLERDLAYLALQVQTPEGRPVSGAKPRFEITGSSKLTAINASESTDDSGMLSFGVAGGKMGADRVTVRVGDKQIEMLVNVVSLKSMGYQTLDEVDGALRWENLMQARLRFVEEKVQADFPKDITAHNGKTVKLVGFMLPLEAEEKQKHFLITANPPSCFFHVPGGPAGAVEVFAEQGIRASWDPIILEGRFETVSGNEMGVIYRLQKARLVTK